MKAHIDVFDDGNEKYIKYENMWDVVQENINGQSRCLLRHSTELKVLVRISNWKIHFVEDCCLTTDQDNETGDVPVILSFDISNSHFLAANTLPCSHNRQYDLFAQLYRYCPL
jgi:hypothetical protein